MNRERKRKKQQQNWIEYHTTILISQRPPSNKTCNEYQKWRWTAFTCSMFFAPHFKNVWIKEEEKIQIKKITINEVIFNVKIEGPVHKRLKTHWFVQ